MQLMMMGLVGLKGISGEYTITLNFKPARDGSGALKGGIVSHGRGVDRS